MAKIDCPKAKEAFAESKIKKFLGTEPARKGNNVTFQSALKGAYDSNLTTPKGIAKEFNVTEKTARSWGQNRCAIKPKTQKKVISFIAQANNIC